LLGKDELVAEYQSKVDEGVFSVEDANNLTNAIVELGD
jgi:hypothetical protein